MGGKTPPDREGRSREGKGETENVTVPEIYKEAEKHTSRETKTTIKRGTRRKRTTRGSDDGECASRGLMTREKFNETRMG